MRDPLNAWWVGSVADGVSTLGWIASAEAGPPAEVRHSLYALWVWWVGTVAADVITPGWIASAEAGPPAEP